ncbi:MAG: vWA domain-containing protein [Ignavibacteriales bacterium]
MQTNKRDAFNPGAVVGNYLNIYFGQQQGVRLGESSVVSLKVHRTAPQKKGHVRILVNRDAGQKFLDYIDPGQVVHISIYHEPGLVDPRKVAKLIFWAIEEYITEEYSDLGYQEDVKFKHAVDYALKIQVTTGAGQGLVYDLFQGQIESVENDESLNQIRILAKLRSDQYGVILAIVEAVEEAVAAEGLGLLKVAKISHAKDKEPDDSLSNFLSSPFRKTKNIPYLTMKESQNQLIVKMAGKFGSIEELDDFLASYSANFFERKSRDEQKRKWGELEQYTRQLEDMGIIKQTIMGPALTKEGKDLREYILHNKCELESELRRTLRRSAKSSGRFHKIGENNPKVARVQFQNRNKVKRVKDDKWAGNLAVPSTVVHAKRSSLLRHEERISFTRDDLHVYGKRSYMPMDICLLIDASASMAGEKRQAACFLAEHLLLTGREKVGVVTFQEMNAELVVPFTRNQKTLEKGLRQIRPGGLTPLAVGIVTSVEAITASRLENPLLILISDGMPNFPLWSFDAKQDALEAAQKIAENRIRLVCIGVESNQEFLRELAEVGRGNLYVVDDLNQSNLIDIVRYEKRTVTKS